MSFLTTGDVHDYLRFCFDYVSAGCPSQWLKLFFMDIVEGTVLAKIVVKLVFLIGIF